MDNRDARTRDACALLFATLFPTAMALIYFVALDGPEYREDPLFLAAIGIGKAIQFLFPIVYVWWFERDRVGFVWPTAKGLPLAAGFGVVVSVAMFALYFGLVRHIPAVSQDTPVKIFDKLVQFKCTTPLAYLRLALFISVVHSLAEEYYWRWFVFGWMNKHLPTALAIVLSSIGFMLHHIVILGVYFPGHFWTLAMPFSICVAVGGGVWAWIYARSGSLYAPWLSHALIDAAILGVGFVMLERCWQ